MFDATPPTPAKKKSRARKTSTLPTRIWTFSARAPTTNAELGHEQYRLASDYRNKLVEIERKRLAAFRARVGQDSVVAELNAKIKILTEEIDNIQTSIKASKAASRSRRVDLQLRTKIKGLFVERKHLYEVLRAAKAKAKDDPALTEDLEKIQAEAGAATRDARSKCGLGWGTYLLVEQAMQMRDKSSDPEFKRYLGNGRIGVQIHDRKLTLARVLAGESNFLQIDPVSEYGYRKASRTQVRLRIGSEGREPVWVEFPILLHQELPLDALVKWAWVIRRQDPSATVHADKDWTGYRYELQLTLEDETFRPPARNSNPRMCAVNFGWRARGEFTRAAFVLADDGTYREFKLPDELVSLKEHADGLEAVRGQHFEGIKAVLGAWYSSKPAGAPAWFTELASYSAQLKSLTRLQDAVWRLKNERFPGDEGLFEALETWRVKDRHLQRYEMSVRGQLTRRRESFQRDWALWISQNFGTVIVDDTDFCETKKKPAAEDQDRVFTSRRERQSLLAPGELRRLVIEANLKRGVRVERIAARTKPCSYCGTVDEWDAALSLEHQCSGCSKTWDQDYNACQNLLADYASASESCEVG